MSSPRIGIFDSGVGGLSVWLEVRKLLPNVSISYLADQQFCPYGTKSDTEIRSRSQLIADFLLSQEKCQLLVVACNTATAAAIKSLRATFPDTPIVGMEPAVKPAALHTQTGHVGLLATAGTLRGRLFQETRDRFASHIELHTQVGDGLVELVEAGKADSQEAKALLTKYLQPMLAAKIDYLVLGCTHYPFLEPALHKILPADITVLNPAEAVARQVVRKFSAFPRVAAQNNPIDYFFSTAQPQLLAHMLNQLAIKGVTNTVKLHQKKPATRN